MTASSRLALPYIAPGQAQKEVTHNEALARLDMAVCASAETLGDSVPPVAPAAGQAWIVGALPTGAWAGKTGQIAAWTDSGWRFLQPFQGLVVWLHGDNVFARWDGTNWEVGIVTANAIRISGEQVVGSRQPPITSPSGGSTVDTQARTAIEEILDALRSHGLVQV